MASNSLLDTNIDELLGGNDTDIVLGDDIDVDAILGTSDELLSSMKEKDQREEPSTTTNSKPEENVEPAPNSNGLQDSEEQEQLDYEEEEIEEKKPPRESKFVSELSSRRESEKRDKEQVPTQRIHADSNRGRAGFKTSNRGGSSTIHGTKYYVNPNFRGPLPPTISANLTNFPVRPFTAPPPMVPSHLPPFVRPFTARPPMHISLMPPPVVHQTPGMASNITSDAMNWSLMVDAFLAKTKSDTQPKQVRSRPGRYSRSSSSGSRSKSRTPNSSNSSSPYSARSPIPSYSRRSKKVARYDRSPVRRAYDQRRKHPVSRRDENKPKPDMKHTIECAQAIGLDEEYLKKIEEQKKMREEIAKRKSQRRQENFIQKKEGNEGRRQIAMDRDSKSGKSSKTSSDNRPKRVDKQDQPKPDVANAQSTMGKLKAYLAVVINNINSLENAYKKISLLAQSVGETKKVWQSSENSVSIIFDKHEHAKQFMLQYHGQIVHGCKLDVTLEKVFLNLATMS